MLSSPIPSSLLIFAVTFGQRLGLSRLVGAKKNIEKGAGGREMKKKKKRTSSYLPISEPPRYVRLG